jgi:hypothetical protein
LHTILPGGLLEHAKRCVQLQHNAYCVCTVL